MHLKAFKNKKLPDADRLEVGHSPHTEKADLLGGINSYHTIMWQLNSWAYYCEQLVGELAKGFVA